MHASRRIYPTNTGNDNRQRNCSRQKDDERRITSCERKKKDTQILHRNECKHTRKREKNEFRWMSARVCVCVCIKPSTSFPSKIQYFVLCRNCYALRVAAAAPSVSGLRRCGREMIRFHDIFVHCVAVDVCII